MQNEVFFGDKGITLTSSDYLHSLASQEKLKYEKILSNLNFVTTKVELIGSDAESKVIKLGYDLKFIDKIKDAVDKCSIYNSFIAWLGEARKALANKQANEIGGYQQWLNDNDLKETAFTPYVSEEQIIDEMSIKERCEWESLIAASAVLGKLITGELKDAHENAHDAILNPGSTSGSGRDTVIYRKTVETPIEDIDNLVSALQQRKREIDKRKNVVSAQIKHTVKLRNIEIDKENDAIRVENSKLFSQFSAWKAEKTEELSKLKIYVPQQFEGIVEYLNGLAKG